MPEIKLNGETRKVEPGSTAEALLRQAGLAPASLIVIVNGEVADAKELASRSLNDGDAIDLLSFAGGG